MNLVNQILAAGQAYRRACTPVPPHKLAMCLRRQQESDQRILPYLEAHGPATVPQMAKALNYTKPGLRLVLKQLERRNLVTGAGFVPGYKGREVKLWRKK